MRVIVVSGVTSGVGKTSLTVGLMAAARRRGFKVQAFKVGPDFLDPLHHEVATGRPSVNLDGWMLNKQQNLESFYRHAADADICIVEGVMGLFDGRDGLTEAGSTAELAKWLGAPVLLVMDCFSVARSAAAMVKGYQEFDPDLNLAGVIFNKIGSASHTQWLTDAVRASGSKTQVFGGVPKDDSIVIKERYLGLQMPHELQSMPVHLTKLADLVEAHIDMEQVFQTAAAAQVPALPQPQRIAAHLHNGKQRVRIGYAKDAAFNFYYNDNLRLLQEAGAELVPFSPIEDCLPANLGGLYLGGGYPEKYAQQLSSNRMLLTAVKAFAEAGGVVYAECGGLIYLSQSIQPLEEAPTSMAGLFPFRTQMTKDKMKMGYIEVETQQGCNLFPANCKARGHVYHFSEILQEKVVGGFSNGRTKDLEWETGYQATMQVPGAEAVPEGFVWKNVLASYVHLHFGSAPELAYSLVARCHSVDLQAVNAAAQRACHQEQHAAAAAEQVAMTHGGHMGGLAHAHMQNGVHQGNMPKMMSVPDFAMPFQQSGYQQASHFSRRSGEEVETPWGRGHSQQQPSHLHQQVQQQQQVPRKVRYDSDGRIVSLDVYAQTYNPADYQSISPQRTSSLPIFHKPSVKPYSMPASPLHDVAEHSSMEAVPNGPAHTAPAQWGGAPQQPPGYPHHPQLHQQISQQLHHHHHSMQHTPFHSPSQGSSSPTYPPPLDGSNSSEVLVLNGVLQPNGTLLPADAMLRAHSEMLPGQSGMLSVNSGMLPEGVVYRPNSMGSAFATVQSAHSGMLGSGRLSVADRMSSLMHPDGVSYRNDDTCTASSSGRMGAAAHEQHAAWSHASAAALAPAGPSMSDNSIVSLLPSGTEILFALGLGHRVSGVSDLCDYPPEAATKPKVSRSCLDSANMSSAQVEARMQELKAAKQSPFTLDREWLQQHPPALLLTQHACRACDVHSSQVAQVIHEMRLDTEPLVLSPRTVADALQDILRVGVVAKVEAEALQLLESLQNRLRAVGRQVAGAKRPKVLSLEGLQPLVLGGQWLPDMKELAGGRDEWQHPGDAPQRITWEAIRQYAPEVLLLCPCSASLERSLGEVCNLAAQPGWWALPAVRTGQVYILEHSLFSRPGPRLVNGIELLARIFHRNLVTKLVPANTALKFSLQNGQRCRPQMIYQHFKPFH